jgi:hypothetical protein
MQNETTAVKDELARKEDAMSHGAWTIDLSFDLFREQPSIVNDEKEGKKWKKLRR